MISPAFPPDLGWDGAARQSYELALGLSAKGHEVEVIAYSNSTSGAISQDGIVVHRLRPSHDLHPAAMIQATTPLSRFLLNSASVFWDKLLERHSSEPFDIIDSSLFTAEPFLPAILGSVPVIARRFDEPPAYISKCLGFARMSAYSLDGELGNALKLSSILISDCLVTTTPELAEETKGLIGYAPLPIECLPPTLDAERFSPGDERALDTSGKRTLIVRGRVKDANTQAHLKDVLLKVTKRLPHLCVVVAAEDVDSEEREEDIKALLQAEGIHCDMTVNSKVSIALMPQILRSADVCLIPSSSRLNPYLCLEAVSCGTALVAMRESDSGFIIDESCARTYAKDDSDSASRAIVDLLENESEFEAVRQRARRLVLEKFDRKVVVEQTVRVYETQLERLSDRSHSKERAARIRIALAEWQRLSASYNKMLYDFLYISSWGFRINHWFNKLSVKNRTIKTGSIITRMRGEAQTRRHS